MFKVKNKTPFSSVSNVDFEQVSIRWVLALFRNLSDLSREWLTFF